MQFDPEESRQLRSRYKGSQYGGDLNYRSQPSLFRLQGMCRFPARSGIDTDDDGVNRTQFTGVTTNAVPQRSGVLEFEGTRPLAEQVLTSPDLFNLGSVGRLMSDAQYDEYI